ncbi:uncharacterized protein LOC115956859 [Quercus lobata]|uniref:uncharacterized protein LOC115956859 n=1 Tax=Quercus lobata TaxID=97700 RepID=UPI001245B1B6|nr:uncharacterized protein LOC115956859 [Quercus lobata]
MRTHTRETPFKLAYRSEAFILVEVYIANHRVMKYQDKENEEQLHLNLDLIVEVRMDAEYKTTRYFNIGDLVLKRFSWATRNSAHGKLGPNWERPYRVINCKRQRSYYLEALDGWKLEHP